MKRLRDEKSFNEFYGRLDQTARARYRYCYQVGSTFIHVNRMEDAIVGAMAMCDRIRIAKVLGPDAKRWDDFMSKYSTLRASTLGSLISILSRHPIEADDLRYLRWLKDKRDFFVHRFFHQGDWPGELNEVGCEIMVRRLLYLEIIFNRATRRIWRVLARAELILIQDLGADGMLMINPGVFEDEEREGATE